VPPKDAIVTIDGFDVTRPTNVIADALAGVTLTLGSPAALTDPDTKVVVGLDRKALTDKVKGLVDAYNRLNASLHVQLDYTGTKKGTNTLFGDATLRQLQGQLATLMSNAYGDSNLGALGISRDKTGAMTLDETKLTAALAADPDAVADVFVGGGFATAVATLADTYTQSGTGLFATKTESLTARSTALQQQIDRITKNADTLRARLEKQFGALEQAMSQLQSQSQYLTSFLR
jgi:flagellar hook-associated protein 2